MISNLLASETTPLTLLRIHAQHELALTTQRLLYVAKLCTAMIEEVLPTPAVEKPLVRVHRQQQAARSSLSSMPFAPIKDVPGMVFTLNLPEKQTQVARVTATSTSC